MPKATESIGGRGFAVAMTNIITIRARGKTRAAQDILGATLGFKGAEVEVNGADAGLAFAAKAQMWLCDGEHTVFLLGPLISFYESYY